MLLGCSQNLVFSQNKNDVSIDFSSLDNLMLERKIDGNFNAINVDAFSNIYVLGDRGQLIKMNEKGERLFAFNDVKKYGKPTFVDVSNPLQILLFYKSVATAVVLDKLLTPRNVIDFRKQPEMNVDVMGISTDNRYWIFNKRDCNLIKMDANLSILFQGDDLRGYINTVPQAEKIFAQSDAVYLYDSQSGLTHFDRYGGFIKFIPLKYGSMVQLMDNFFIGWSEKLCQTFDLTSQEEKVYTLPKMLVGAKSIMLQNQNLFVLKESGVEIYSMHK